jgi:hypothetical protein
MRWALGAAVFLLLLVVGAVVVGVMARMPRHDVVLPPPPQETAAPLPPPAVGSQWRYTAPRAGYASDAGVEACTKSLADITIAGGDKSAVRLCLRRGGGYPYAGSIVLNDPDGQFACAECAVKARFDGGAEQSFDATAASTDGTAYALFIRDGAGLAGALKRASAVTVTVTLRGAGAQAVTFNVAGLKWTG